MSYSGRPVLAGFFIFGRSIRAMSEISFKHKCEYYAMRGLALLFRRLPREKALKLGGRLGILAGMVLSKRFRLAEENLRRAFPGWSQRKVRLTCWANFQHIGICGVEMLRLDMLSCEPKELEHHYQLADWHHLEEALELGKGAIALTGHFGFWESGHYALPAGGIDFVSVAKPMKNPLTDRYINNIREAFGGQVLNSRHGARRILKSLQQGKTVAILLDQHISPPGSVPTQFFGRPAYTTTAITNLAMKYQVPVVPMFCQRLADGRYQIAAQPMIFLTGQGEEAIIANTQHLTDIIETAVRRDPSQWFWMHKRWRVPEERSSEDQG
jgi:KDO2-lipid IV(A) lauroyltransferase